MHLSPLLSDYLFFALLLAFAFVLWRFGPSRQAWRHVFANPGAMAAMPVLTLCFAIAMVDSIRLQDGGERLSLLDRLCGPFVHNTEKTYSAPLATHLLNHETVIGIQGEKERIRPPLSYVDAQLRDDRVHNEDIAWRLVQGVVLGVLLWLVLALLIVAILRRRWRSSWAEVCCRLWRGHTHAAYRAFLSSLLLLCVITAVLGLLAAAYHVLGTNKVGQDVLYLSLKSLRTGIILGTLTSVGAVPLAVGFGLIAGYFGGWVDDAVQYLYTVINSIPGVLLIAATALMMQVAFDTHPQWFATAESRADAQLIALCFILGITGWIGLCRLLRGEALKLREMDFVLAARAFAVPHWKILLTQLLPNTVHLILICVVMDFSAMVLAEAVLSYIGIGVAPQTISFGSMINSARDELARQPMIWWSLVSSFCFMLGLVLSANLLADAVNEALNPRLSNKLKSLNAPHV